MLYLYRQYRSSSRPNSKDRECKHLKLICEQNIEHKRRYLPINEDFTTTTKLNKHADRHSSTPEATYQEIK